MCPKFVIWLRDQSPLNVAWGQICCSNAVGSDLRSVFQQFRFIWWHVAVIKSRDKNGGIEFHRKQNRLRSDRRLSLALGRVQPLDVCQRQSNFSLKPRAWDSGELWGRASFVNAGTIGASCWNIVVQMTKGRIAWNGWSSSRGRAIRRNTSIVLAFNGTDQAKPGFARPIRRAERLCHHPALFYPRFDYGTWTWIRIVQLASFLSLHVLLSLSLSLYSNSLAKPNILH